MQKGLAREERRGGGGGGVPQTWTSELGGAHQQPAAAPAAACLVHLPSTAADRLQSRQLPLAAASASVAPAVLHDHICHGHAHGLYYHYHI